MKCMGCGGRFLVLNQITRAKKKQDHGKLVCDECFEVMQVKEDKK